MSGFVSEDRLSLGNLLRRRSKCIALLRCLHEGGGCTMEQLCELLGDNRRAVARTIVLLRERYGAEIRWDIRNQMYVLTNASAFPVLSGERPNGDDELFALREKPPERIAWASARMNREELRRARRALKERSERTADDADAE